MSVVVITPPAMLPVTLAQAKAQCSLDAGNTDDDDLIQDLMADATAALDGPQGWLGRALMPQTLELRLDGFCDCDWQLPGAGYAWSGGGWWSSGYWPFPAIALPCPPLISVTSIIYEDFTGTDQVLDSSGWRSSVDGVTPAFGDVWPSGRVEASAVRIQYQAGYPAASAGGVLLPNIPRPIRRAILLLVAHWYANREAVVGVESRDSSTELPLGVQRLLQPFLKYE